VTKPARKECPEKKRQIYRNARRLFHILTVTRRAVHQMVANPPLWSLSADKVIHVVDPDRADQNQIDRDNIVQERWLQ
jgi:hypothetical protein